MLACWRDESSLWYAAMWLPFEAGNHNIHVQFGDLN